MRLTVCLQIAVLIAAMFSVPPARGACVKQHQCGPCRRNWDPVCGSDGKTYSNSCVFSCIRNNCSPDLEIEYEGECGGKDSKESQEQNEAEAREVDDAGSDSSEEEDDDNEDVEDERKRSLLSNFKAVKY